MATSGKPGIGVVINKWDTTGTSGVWTPISEITAISWEGANRETIEVYILASTDEYMNKIQGLMNAGSVSLSIVYTKAQFTILKTDLETRGNVDYQIVFPDGEALEFEGFVTELPLDFMSDDLMNGEVTIEIDGKADFVSSASTAPS
jgi:hypothetical protein